MLEAPAVETCPRCGSFASLVDTGLKRVCAACVEPSLHPLQRAGGDPVKLLVGVWRVMVEFGWWNLVILLALVAPWFATSGRFSWLGSAFLALLVVVLSLVETVAFLAWRARVLEAKPVPWRLVGPRLPRVLATNGLLALVTLVCLPLGLLWGPLASAVAVAALEGRWPLDAARTAWRRSEGRRVALVVVGAISFLPTLALPLIPLVVAAVATLRTGRPVQEWTAPLLPALAFAYSLGALPSFVMQAAAWLATVPVPRPSELP
ncbi:MAG: hypothetical protein SFW67_16855 [Myxococcaceae bacterium]|nr:hypothetical protein [Myxococcaceae bacterium]